MTPETRRAQLLDVGEAVFGEGRFEELSMEDIAAAAGVTRASLYHYFPTKADYFAAIWQRAHESLGATTQLDDCETVRDWIVEMLTGYLDFYSRHVQLVLIANRSSIASAPAVREPIADNFRTLCRVALDTAGARGRRRRLAEAAFAGWIAFVRETTLATLVDGAMTPKDNLAMCVATLDATVGAHADLDRRIRGRA